MYINKLLLKNFRNYTEACFEFSPNLNLICGPNAIGKTTVLEALHTLMIGRSFRTQFHLDLINKSFSFFYLECHLTKHGIEQVLRIHFNDRQERKIIYNNTSVTQLTHLIGIIQGVIQTPDDVNLIKGPPSLRRQFLDIQIAQTNPLYVHHLTRFSRALKQRNNLLKSKKLAGIETWEHEMALSAGYIVDQRQQTINRLQKNTSKYYTELTGEETTIGINYKTHSQNCQSAVEIRDYYTSHLEKNREKEKGAGFTFIGPHKDELLILIGEKEAKTFASEGQQRSCAAALHFSEWDHLKQKGTDYPLFMIDDVGMSLDNERKGRLINALSNLGQVFLTTTDTQFLDSHRNNNKIFELS